MVALFDRYSFFVCHTPQIGYCVFVFLVGAHVLHKQGHIRPQLFGEQSASFSFGFYGLGQFSKYLTNGTPGRKGAVRVYSETTLRGFSGVAFKNPDGEIVLVLINNVGEKTIRLVMDGSEAVVKVPQGTVTLRWYPVTDQK